MNNKKSKKSTKNKEQSKEEKEGLTCATVAEGAVAERSTTGCLEASVNTCKLKLNINILETKVGERSCST